VSSLLEVRDLSVHFSGVVAVDHVSLDIEQGRLYGLVGPNGSGKTTLLGAISRLVEPWGGRLAFAGRDYTRLSADRAARLGIARSYQAIRLLPSLSVLENVMLGADMVAEPAGILDAWLALPRARRSERGSRQAARAVLDRLGLADLAQHDPTSLPYGTQRRVEIARAIATRPRLLLLDEPAAGMNQAEAQAIADLLGVVSKDGVTVILVEHNMRMVMGLCEHIYVMNFGRLIASGDPATVTADETVREAYLGKKHHVAA
jgi:branched-chain amino acid transport system ATP-binding protein